MGCFFVFGLAPKLCSRIEYSKGGGGMRRRDCRKNRKLSLILFGAGVLCLCLLSAKLMLVVLAVALIGLGIWLLRC